MKLFVTQGGLQSLQEAIHFAVPVVGIPLFADQSGNVRKVELAGAGVTLDFDNLDSDTVFTALDTALHVTK